MGARASGSLHRMEEDIVCPIIRKGERQMNKEYLSTDIPVSSLTYALKGQKLLERINAARAQARQCGGQAFAASAPLAW